jgi:hypothetical protein
MDTIEARILALSGSRIVTLVVETEPKLKKHSLGRITKRSRVNGIVGAWDYTKAVEKATGEDHDTQPRKWGRRIPGTGLVEHKGEKYVEVKVQSSKHQYLLDGQEVPDEVVEPYLPARTSDAPVILRDYKLSSILEIQGA